VDSGLKYRTGGVERGPVIERIIAAGIVYEIPEK
jgi:hypothetical protein